jgi:DhnA family fructose-bisphosphate aldolase class Ia
MLKEEFTGMFTRRLDRIFRNDGRSLIVAFDHGLTEGPTKGMEEPGKILAEIVAGGADAILTSYGIAMRFAREISSLGLILRLDVGGTKLGTMGPGIQYFKVEDAIRAAADAVAISAFPGTAQEQSTMQMLAGVIAEAHTWGMPVMAELQPGGFDAGPEFFTTENIALSARVAAELGADWVKVPHAENFNQVISSCYVPVVVLGGVKAKDERVLFEVVHTAIQDGATGVAIGRNIFQAEYPASIVTALAAIIHNDANVDTACEIYHQSLPESRHQT